MIQRRGWEVVATSNHQTRCFEVIPFPGDDEAPDRVMVGVIAVRSTAASGYPIPMVLQPKVVSKGAVGLMPPNRYSEKYVGKRWIDDTIDHVGIRFQIETLERKAKRQRVRVCSGDPFATSSHQLRSENGEVASIPSTQTPLLRDQPDPNDRTPDIHVDDIPAVWYQSPYFQTDRFTVREWAVEKWNQVFEAIDLMFIRGERKDCNYAAQYHSQQFAACIL